MNERNPSLGKQLYDEGREGVFYERRWHLNWVKKQYDKIYDKVESICIDATALEVRSLGMGRAPELRDHIHKQFGGSGDDACT